MFNSWNKRFKLLLNFTPRPQPAHWVVFSYSLSVILWRPSTSSGVITGFLSSSSSVVHGSPPSAPCFTLIAQCVSGYSVSVCVCERDEAVWIRAPLYLLYPLCTEVASLCCVIVFDYYPGRMETFRTDTRCSFDSTNQTPCLQSNTNTNKSLPRLDVQSGNTGFGSTNSLHILLIHSQG